VGEVQFDRTQEFALQCIPKRGKTGSTRQGSKGGKQMDAHKGDGIVFESERAGQPAHRGVIEEVVREQPPCFRVRWEDGHESIVTPAAGAARIEPEQQPAKN
jgi:hypothetical protein